MVDDKMSTSYVPNGPVLHPSLNYQTNNLQLRTPQMFQFAAQMKQEPIDDEKMDSGINSGGSDFQSSSPGSDQSSSDHYLNQPQYFSTPKIGQFPAFPQLTQQHQQQQQQHPLTPPNSEPLISPNSGDCDETTLTPCSSPGTISNHDDSEIGNVSDNNNDIKVPKVNSNSGKTKTMKCKQCSFACTTKEVFWDHIRTHIREDKRLSCTQCNFVTEYKHHLEYHLRNHAGSKPFKCPNCNYTCVNKSMLNSHMKSHSNIYQYHCADCNYATKYCHSLKLHLRKHGHQPGLVLDQEGKPNPLPIIDVYGTRRGPKMKPKNEHKQDKQPPKPEQESTMFPAPPPPPPPTFIPPHLSLALSLLNQFPSPDVAAAHFNQLILERQLNENNEADTESEASQGVLDLSQPSTSATAATTTTATGQQSRSRRKGVAVKFVKTDQESDTENETKPEISTKEENNNETKSDDDDDDQQQQQQQQKTDHKEYRCQHCDMGFGDEVLYTLHMSFHGTNDPFSCNTCGIICENRIAFYVHITRNAH